MKSFKEFLKESKWDHYLYHATYGDFDPKEINSGSHFGTLHAAMSRARSQDINAVRAGLKIHAYKHNPSGKAYIASDPDKDKLRWHSRKAWQSVDNLSSGTPDDSLKNQGYSHLHYPNAIENPGSRSTVVLDPKDLEHIHTFKKPKFLKRSIDQLPHPYYDNPIKKRRIGSIVREQE